MDGTRSKAGDADEEVDLDYLPVDRRLRLLIGDPVPASEKKLWLAMSTDQRDSAMRRMKAMARWHAGRPPVPSDAAKGAGLTLNRFYEMAKAWRTKRSIASVETMAIAPRARSSDYDTILSKHVQTVVATVPEGAKVTLKELIEKLGAAAAAELDVQPSFATLRRRVQEEMRRRERRVRPGGEVQFDCCAITMSTMDTPQRVLFVILDRRTQLVLGAALGDARRGRVGYAHAAADALRRVTSGSLRAVAWTGRLEKMELVVGLDEADLSRVAVEFVRAGIRSVMQPSNAPRRFGRYLRKAVGDRMGRILLLSSDDVATSASATTSDLDGTSDDAVRVQVEIEVHDATLLADLERDDASEPPADLLTTLRLLADWRDREPSAQPEAG